MSERMTEDADFGRPAEHLLKVAPEYWLAVLDGSKTFEVRRNDRAFQKGDVLALYPTHSQAGREYCKPDCTDQYCSKPPVVRRRISFVYSGDPRFGGHGGMQPGYVVLGMVPDAE